MGELIHESAVVDGQPAKDAELLEQTAHLEDVVGAPVPHIEQVGKVLHGSDPLSVLVYLDQNLDFWSITKYTHLYHASVWRSGCQPAVPKGRARVKWRGMAARLRSETSCSPVDLCITTSLWPPPSVAIILTSFGQT